MLPDGVTCRLAVEAGVPHLWHRLVGPAGRVIGMHRFGESAPGDRLFEHFGFTAGHVADEALAMLAAR